MSLQFRTENVASSTSFLSLEECGEIIRTIEASPREPAQVVRAGETILDQSLRSCFDHHLPDAFKRSIGDRMATYFEAHRAKFDSDADHIYGPYFMSYQQGSYFRAHRDVANHRNDPLRLAAHRWSLLVYLNGREATGSLPTFEGGALIIYESHPKLHDRRVIIVPQPGMLVAFRSSLMHEVAVVQQGTRYAIAGWMSSSKCRLPGDYR
jgi:predicted 2-oxoglutarate/Fe(II)-dependent dioxygenase YbiX